MQSSHFDVSTYHGAIYGSPAGYDTGNFKFHHTGYTGDPDSACYSNYISPSIPGYDCRDPPAYTEASTFYYSSGGASSYDISDSFKIQNGQTDVMDCTHVPTMTRQPNNFLYKPHDSLVLANLQNIRGSNSSSSSSSVHNDHSHHNHYQQHLHHLRQQRTFDDAPENMAANESVSAGRSVFGLTSVKMESLKTEKSQSHGEFEEPVNSLPVATSSTTSRNIQEDFATVTHHVTTQCDQMSPALSENKTSLSKNSAETCHVKEIIDEKKEEEISSDAKPTMSYIALIAKAIQESEQRRLNLGSIYNWIEHHYPFYKNKGQGWRNSVRHNLSLNDCFIKAGRCEDGKGNYWAIHPANIQDFMRGDFRQRRRSRRRGRKKDCDINMYHVPNGYLQPPSSSLTPGMTFSPAALSSIYSPYTEAERRAYRLDEALLRQNVNNPFVKWYQHGVPNSGYGVSTSPPACSKGIYPNPTPLQWPQAYTDSSTQAMYPSLNSTFSR